LKDPVFDIVISRAFSSLTDFTRLTRSAISKDGVWAAMKGQTPKAEIQQVPADIDVFHVEQLEIAGGAKRCIVWMRIKQSL
jgi:16S rRNA (guanine527-N7)-methyltransferase